MMFEAIVYEGVDLIIFRKDVVHGTNPGKHCSEVFDAVKMSKCSCQCPYRSQITVRDVTFPIGYTQHR
jgi:hypothetical protein